MKINEGTSTWKREMIGTGTDLHPKTLFHERNDMDFNRGDLHLEKEYEK
jgi:hypothetical protein